MRLAAESHRLIETFLRERFQLATLRLPPVFIYRGRLARAVTSTFKIGAITLGRHILVTPKLVTSDGGGNPSIPGWLIAHEATHIWQYKRAGFVGFLVSYLTGYWRALRAQPNWGREARLAAYLAIDEECEARESEAVYDRWIARENASETERED
ncbi:MAG TPA: DUF4157 domain-containing protein [Pyrinomonadaceae bacterium]|jgi:hypothetical protein|nr:DUF4157 domain-containing protein [Pyrinomonadaceae bacterium]